MSALPPFWIGNASDHQRDAGPFRIRVWRYRGVDADKHPPCFCWDIHIGRETRVLSPLVSAGPFTGAPATAEEARLAAVARLIALCRETEADLSMPAGMSAE
jgi:hypothetical protein